MREHNIKLGKSDNWHTREAFVTTVSTNEEVTVEISSYTHGWQMSSSRPFYADDVYFGPYDVKTDINVANKIKIGEETIYTANATNIGGGNLGIIVTDSTIRLIGETQNIVAVPINDGESISITVNSDEVSKFTLEITSTITSTGFSEPRTVEARKTVFVDKKKSKFI